MPAPDTPNRRVRLVIQQPALAKYRVPVFRELAGRSGIDLKLYYSDTSGAPHEEPDGFDTQYVPTRRWRVGSRTLWWHPPQWTQATRKAADVLILSWNLHYASLVPALLRARRNGVGTILWGHGYSKHEAAWRAWPRRKVARLADALLFYNHTAAQRHMDAGVPRERVFVALNALDQTPIQNARQHWLDRPDELQRFRREHKLTEGPVILFVSRFERANRLDLLLQATARLRDRYPTLRTVVIGKGEPEGEHLRELAASSNFGDAVRFPGAIYDEHKLAPWFLAADLFCYPANIGLSMLHAFGYGLPVITSDRVESQNPEIEALRPGENGLLYHHGDADALAEALDRVLSDSAYANRLSDAAHRTATERFTLTNMVDGMEAAIWFCVERRAHRAVG